MTEEPRILVALATYNEILNLPNLVKQLLDLPIRPDVLVVDDNSPDGTGAWAQKFSESEPRFHVVVRKNERGLGTAVIRALQYAVDNNYDFVVNMDADFSHPVDVLPGLVERACSADGADVVIGSRYVPGGSTPDWTLKRRMMSRCINTYARVMLGLRTKDNSGSYRCYRCALLKELDFSSFLSTGYSFFEEMLFRLKRVGARFAEIPITFTDRQAGVSKINRKEAVKAVWILTRIGLSRLFGKV